ncbi:MAG TPA: hypothetical protein VMC43_00390 [Candidatus Paceibacterota bacterium]|nr:hypothetical protein [Candidatus Paceibacterota bacterium]
MKKTNSAGGAGTKPQGFTDEEKSAMRARAQELLAEKSRAEGERAVLAVLSKMSPADRAIGTRLHAIVKANAPSLWPKTWYGMPAYANKDGQIVCFYQCAGKFKTRYGTFGFQHAANLDEGHMWPVIFAVTKLTPAEEKKLAALVKKAVG